MKDTPEASIPDTTQGLEIFIKECAKEINKLSKLQKTAQERLDLRQGKELSPFKF